MKRHVMNDTLDGFKDKARVIMPGPDVRLMYKAMYGKSVPGLCKNQNCYSHVNHVCICSNISDMYIL